MAHTASIDELARAIRLASTPGFASLKLVHTSQPHWPGRPNSSSIRSNHAEPIHIAILDSSFNPPHLAHLGIAASAFPSPINPSCAFGPGPYTARLLLFSARNVDKVPKPGDASTAQRVQMTVLLAQGLARAGPAGDIGPGGVAVGLINEPTFAGKSRIIHAFLRQHLAEMGTAVEAMPRITLSFLIGTDTLTRFFDEKYYPNGMQPALAGFFDPPPDGEGSILVSARRGDEQEGLGVEHEVLGREGVKAWVHSGSIRVMGSAGKGLEEVSSTAIRQAAGDASPSGQTRLRELVPESIADFIETQKLYRD